jgi:flagellar hook-length control protein FliK
MISSARPSTTKPATSDAPTTAPGTAPATAGADAAAPFDTLLAAEAQAATLTTLDAAALNAAGTPELDGTTLAPADDADDDSETPEVEGPLAFLASLLNAAAVTPRVLPAGSASGDAAGHPAGNTAGHSAGNTVGGQNAMDDALGVCAKPVAGTAPDATPDNAAQPGGANGAASPAVADAALAAKLLAMAGNPADTSKDPADARSDATTDVSGDAATATAGAARAAELFAHNLRHPVAANERTAIATPVRDPRWADDLGTRVALMVRGGESSASLQLSPPELGPLDVNVTVRDSQASIHFGAAQAETRALLEASIPRLREMLAAQGFQLMDASVSQGFARQSRAQPTLAGRPDAEAEIEVRATPGVRLAGLLDTYA